MVQWKCIAAFQPFIFATFGYPSLLECGEFQVFQGPGDHQWSGLTISTGSWSHWQICYLCVYIYIHIYTLWFKKKKKRLKMERYPLYCILLMKSKMDSISLQSVSMPLQVQSPMSFMLHDASILMLRNCLKIGLWCTCYTLSENRKKHTVGLKAKKSA